MTLHNRPQPCFSCRLGCAGSCLTLASWCKQVGSAEIVARVVEDLKDESEPYRRMVMETIDKVVKELGSADIDARLEELLIDGILYAFQEQVRSLFLRLCRVRPVNRQRSRLQRNVTTALQIRSTMACNR